MSAEQSIPQIPQHVYRGIVVPHQQVTEEFLGQDLITTTPALADENGRAVITDGNEYGVYTSTNQHMVEQSYARARSGVILPDSPVFAYRGARQVKLAEPKAGVTYRIATDGLALRKPYITPVLAWVENNGFEGSEYIADGPIPAKNVGVASLQLGQDTLHGSKLIAVEGNDTQRALEAMRAEIAHRSARLALAREVILSLSDQRRSNEFAVDRALREAQLS